MKLIFKFFLLLILHTSDLYAKNIFNDYEKIKNQIKTNQIIESGDYFFSGSFGRYGSIESIDIEKNKIKAINNFLKYISDSIDWPENLSNLEKKKKWSSYNSKTKVNLEGIVLVDNGKIGSNYFVIMGIKKEVLFKNRVTFNKLEEIINQ